MVQLGLRLSDLNHLAPELALVISAVVISLIDMMLPKRVNRTLIGWLSLAAILLSAVLVCTKMGLNAPVEILLQSYRIDDFANIVKLILLAGTALIVLMSIGSVKDPDIPHVGEYYYLLLPALVGGMIMASSGDLITLYVGLEVLSISSYIMVAMRKKNLQSTEGAFKYAVQGAISSAFILYGMSFLYGISGTTNLAEINSVLQGEVTANTFAPFLYVSFFLMLAGFGFKVAAAPFHAWAPDVYQGAPTPISAFLAVVSKAAAFAVLFRIIYNVYYSLNGSEQFPVSADVFLSLGVLAAAAMIVGNLLALRQKNVKRLLAYSGIANAGYLLVPIASSFSLVHYSNFFEFIYYLIAYMLMNIGAFAVLMAVEQASGESELKGFAGLYHRAPWTAFAMVLIVMSLAGFPVTGGFFGKLFILMGTLETQNYWLPAIMILTSVISYYYYYGFIRQMFMRSHAAKPLSLTPALGITIWICAGLGVVMGFFPQWIINSMEKIFKIGQDLLLM